jgi:hypothetical protein
MIKIMRSFILSLLILTVVSGASYAQTVAIPDTAFLYALLYKGVDTNGDSLISHAEAEAVTSLDISKSTSLKTLNIADMPTLYEVCVWTMPFPPEGVDVNTSGSPDIFFTDTCGSCYVGVNEYQADGFSLYPNPVNNRLTIETNATGLLSLRITSLNGQLIYSELINGPTHQIDLTFLRKGFC